MLCIYENSMNGYATNNPNLRLQNSNSRILLNGAPSHLPFQEPELVKETGKLSFNKISRITQHGA